MENGSEGWEFTWELSQMCESDYAGEMTTNNLCLINEAGENAFLFIKLS